MSTPSSIVGEQYSTGSSRSPEPVLAVEAQVVGHLRGVLAGLDAEEVLADRAVQVDEEAVGLDAFVGQVRHANVVVVRAGAVGDLPPHRRRRQLEAGVAVVVGADDLDEAVERETVEELLDDLGRVVERELAVRSERRWRGAGTGRSRRVTRRTPSRGRRVADGCG